MAKYYILIIVFIVLFTVVLWKPTLALFTDSASAQNNTFTAATEFPEEETPTNIADHVVISEVQITGGTGLSENDFVELYNPTSSSITITGWKLRVRTSTGSELSLAVMPTAILAAHSYYLWASTDNGFAITVGADTSNSNNLSADNSIALLTSLDVMIDQVGWGSGTNQFVEGSLFTQNPIANQSIERKAQSTATTTSMAVGGGDEFKGNGFDAGNNATDFILRTVSQPQNSGSESETL